MREIAETILRLTSSASTIQHLPLPTDDPTRRCPDITRAIEQLGWRPTVTTEDGLTVTIDHFAHLLGL